MENRDDFDNKSKNIKNKNKNFKNVKTLGGVHTHTHTHTHM